MELLPGKLNNNKDINQIPVKSLAHLGDAAYELYARRKTIFLEHKLEKVHKLTTSLVNAQFHADLLEYLMPHLTEKEIDIVKRGRNQALSSSKRKEQVIHRISTSFEALIGYLYLTDEKRLLELFKLTDTFIEKSLDSNNQPET